MTENEIARQIMGFAFLVHRWIGRAMKSLRSAVASLRETFPEGYSK
jgi:hypothetical protein